MSDPYSDLVAGDELVHEHVSYFMTTRTPDGRFMAISSTGVVLMMPDPETGMPAFPTSAMLREAHRSRNLFFRSKRLGDAVRADARDEEATPAEIEMRDGWAPLRRMVVRQWDQEPKDAKPMRSDAGLRLWFEESFDKPDIVARFGRVPCPTTLRTWISTRGAANDRRAVDMENRSGKVARRRRYDERVIALGQLHALAGTARRGRRQKVCYSRFKRDVARLHAGGTIEVDGLEFVYEVPDTPLKPYGRETFRREWWKAMNADSIVARLGTKAKRARYGGGGVAQEPTRLLDVVQGDDTPFPNHFLIDPYDRVPVGPCTSVFNFCVKTKCFVGWDDSFDEPSTATWMRSVLHVSEPKEVPERFREEFPGLADIHGYVTGCYLFDNALQNTARAVEDAGGDLCHEVRVGGEGEPTHKAEVERSIGTMQGYMEEVPGSTLDIPHLREFGYDPEKHVLITIEDFRRLRAEAIATYHTQPHEGLDGRCPLDVWTEQVRIHGIRQARDQDQFIRSIGTVDFVRFTRTGCLVNGLRYSAGDNAELLADMATALGPPSNLDDIAYRVKVKSYDVDLSHVSVFNPHTRRYVHLECMARSYSKDLPLWLHDRVRQFAKFKRWEFATEEQMEAARIGFSDIIAQVSPEADARQRKLTARLLDRPATRRRLGESLKFIRVKPSATGLENVDVVEHDLRSAVRRDALTEAPRPARGGRNSSLVVTEAQAESETIERIAKSARRRGTRTGEASDDRRSRRGAPASTGKSDGSGPVVAAKPLPDTSFS